MQSRRKLRFRLIVEFVDYGQMQAGHAVTGEVDHVAAVFQVIADIGGDVVVVLDHQHAHRDSGSRALLRAPASLARIASGRSGGHFQGFSGRTSA